MNRVVNLHVVKLSEDLVGVKLSVAAVRVVFVDSK